jgi:glycosyltransferase involved in cell wall biosynthesis
MNPQVSVAIATYNRAAMVRQAVEAALAQTLAPYEVVVADDASTDDTADVLARLAAADARVRVFRRERNSGGVDNWNFVMGQTRGGYIAWCSDDDRFLPDHLEASVAYLEAHPEAGLVHSGFVDAVESAIGVETHARPLRFAAARLLTRRGLAAYLTRYYDWPFHPSTLVMRRRVWEQTGCFDARYALADTDWFARAVERFPAALLARHGVLNRRHAGNWSNRLGSARMQREIFEIVERSLARVYAGEPLRRCWWRMVWRWNVRLHLLLTVRARVRGGHAEAACAAWRELAGGTGWTLPFPVARAGERWIRRFSHRAPALESARQRMSPL